MATPERQWRRRGAAEPVRAPGPRSVIAGSAAAQALHPLGRCSPDGAAVVGRDGWLFVAGGSNDAAAQFRGLAQLSPAWASQWDALLERQRCHAEQLGAALATLVVPDKIAVLPGAFTGRAAGFEDRPIGRLARLAHGRLCYPLEALAGVPGAYLRTDSHVAPRGALRLLGAVLDQYGLPVPAAVTEAPTVDALAVGDLGVKFVPPISEVMTVPAACPHVRIVADTTDVVRQRGGHAGLVRVTGNEAAPRPETIVVLGGSGAYPQPECPGTLGDLLARTFAGVHFLWAPFGWAQTYLEMVRPDLILVQTAERFIVRVPPRDALIVPPGLPRAS